MNSPTMPKFCKDCAHFSQQTKRPPTCTAPDAVKIDLVFGRIETNCYDARLDSGACGAEAQLFKRAQTHLIPIHAQDLLTAWTARKLFTEQETSPSQSPPSPVPNRQASAEQADQSLASAKHQSTT